MSLDEIQEYIEKGDYKTAIKNLEEIISKEPENSMAFYLRGKATYLGMNTEIEDTIESGYNARRALIYSTIEYDLSKAVSLNPEILDAYRGLMYVNKDIGNTQKEREYAKILIEKNEEALDGVIFLARSFLNKGEKDEDFEQAIELYNKFLEKGKEEEDLKNAMFEKALCYFNLTEYKKADDEANNLIQNAPFFDRAYYLKGIVLSRDSVENERHKEALFFFDKAIELNENFESAYYERAMWYYSIGDYKKSIENYDTVLKLSPKRIEAMIKKAQAMHDLLNKNDEENTDYSDTEEGTKYFEDTYNFVNHLIEELKIVADQLIYLRASLKAYNGDYREAVSQIKKILNPKAKNINWLYEKAASWLFQYAETTKENKEIISLLKKINEEELGVYEYYMLSTVAYDTSNYELAAKACKKFFELNKDSDNNWEFGHFIYAYSLEQLDSKDYETIIFNYKKLLKKNTDNYDIIEDIGRVMLHEAPHKYLSEALEYLEKAADAGKSFAMHILSTEYFFGERGGKTNPEKAIKYAEKSFERDPSLECPLVIIGKSYELGHGNKQDSKKAFEYYKKAYVLNKKEKNICSCSDGAIAHAYYKGIGIEKNKEKAIDIVSKTVKKKGNQTHDNAALLYIYFALKGYEDVTIEKAIELAEYEVNSDYCDTEYFMLLKRLYKKSKLKEHKEKIKFLEEKESEKFSSMSNFNKEHLKNYIGNFNIFYPIYSRKK